MATLLDEWILYSLSDEQANEMSEVLTKVRSRESFSCESLVTYSNPKAFKGRLLEVIDQAQHFAALGQAGTGGSLGNTAQSFREGLDTTERDRKDFPSNYWFFLTEERKSSR